ncbi:MAG: DUF4332 domain-containing protein [Halobacteriales archaeon]|nr:DUF4332 domain-containing protein [Halobacteriales archaeon]
MMDTRNDINGSTWKDLYDLERKRLSMLWKAFEDAERRVQELESRLTDLSEAPIAPPARTATVATVPEIVEVVRPMATLTDGNGGGERTEMEPQTRFPVKLMKTGDLPGIKATEVEKLRTYGINVTDEMLHADLDRLAEASGVDRQRLQRFRDLSEVIGVKGIGPVWGERLVDAGINDIRHLAKLTPEELSRTLLRSYEKQGLGEKRMLVLQRTLPARAGQLIAASKRDARNL